MSSMTPKIKSDLAYLYELPEFQSFKKLCELKRMKAIEQILGTDMSSPGSREKIAMIQGQALALQYILLEMKKIHKVHMEKEN